MITGIHLNAVPIDRALVAALPRNHMEELPPPPRSVMANTYPAGDPSWLRLDSTYPAQMRERFYLLANKSDMVLDRLPGEDVSKAEYELRDRVVSWLTTQHPHAFNKHGDMVTSPLTGVGVDVGPQGAPPMAAVAALASEDFLLMLPAEADPKGQTIYRLKSGALLFPNGWSLRSFFDKPEPPRHHTRQHAQWEADKQESITSARLGKSVFEIHHKRVPQYEVHFATGVDRLFNTMAAERVIWRRNWGTFLSNTLFRHADTEDPAGYSRMTQKSLRQRGYIRSEHETFVRLPQSRAVAFGIKTYLWRLSRMLESPKVFNALAQAVMNATPETRQYQEGRIEPLEKLLRGELKRRGVSAPGLNAVKPPA